MKTIIVSLAFFMVTTTYVETLYVKISWEDAAWAVERGDLDVVSTFLENHQIDEEGTYFEGPASRSGVILLEVAAYHGNVDAVQQLLKAQPGPNINHQDAVGSSPLILAAFEGHLEVTRMLLDAEDIDINQQNNFGYSALMLAAVNGQKDVVELLIKQSDINLDLQLTRSYKTGYTALDLAKDRGYFDIAELLGSKNAACNKNC